VPYSFAFPNVRNTVEPTTTSKGSIMAREIERKFLVADQSWRDLCTNSERLTDGLLAISNERKIRVRTYESRATITVKTRGTGATREKFEYSIPFEDARELISKHCDGNVLEKIRHYVPYRDLFGKSMFTTEF
jgi:adenylate cyclase